MASPLFNPSKKQSNVSWWGSSEFKRIFDKFERGYPFVVSVESAPNLIKLALESIDYEYVFSLTGKIPRIPAEAYLIGKVYLVLPSFHLNLQGVWVDGIRLVSLLQTAFCAVGCDPILEVPSRFLRILALSQAEEPKEI